MVRIVSHVVSRCVVKDEENNLVSTIGPGLVLYIGLCKRDDGLSNVDVAVELINKIIQQSYYCEESEKLVDECERGKLEIMVCSNITLYAEFKKNRLQFHRAENVDKARLDFIEIVKHVSLIDCVASVQRSRFREFMNIEMCDVTKTLFMEK